MLIEANNAIRWRSGGLASRWLDIRGPVFRTTIMHPSDADCLAGETLDYSSFVWIGRWAQEVEAIGAGIGGQDLGSASISMVARQRRGERPVAFLNATRKRFSPA